jgi:hypothetical protein
MRRSGECLYMMILIRNLNSPFVDLKNIGAGQLWWFCYRSSVSYRGLYLLRLQSGLILDIAGTYMEK